MRCVQRVDMRSTFGFTSPAKRHHRLLVNMRFDDGLIWPYFAAIVPAFLAYLLLFVETEITQ